MTASPERRPVRKAVIPAAGLGTRFLPATKAMPKEMLTLVDRPAIQYVVEEAVAAGITDVLIVTGRSKKPVEDHFDRAPELEASLAGSGKEDLLESVIRLSELASFHFVRQGEPLGLGHAVGVARDHVGDEPFVVLLPDDLMHHASPLLSDMMAAHALSGRSAAARPPCEAPENSLSGVAPLAASAGSGSPGGPGPLRRLTGLVEKPSPADAPSDLAIMGRYLFTPEIFELIDEVKPGKGGEIQLTDAMNALAAGSGIDGVVFDKGRFDIGSKPDYLRAAVEFALDRADLGPDFGAWLGQLVRERGL
ncbi:MAG: UTP--glucose-1-phosphate uridylyltransferase GalU [Acidimicrobiales bacterium]